LKSAGDLKWSYLQTHLTGYGRMMESMCCVDCFAHEWLRGYIHDNSGVTGDCDYCHHKGVNLIAISELYDPFNNLMGLYVPSDNPEDDMLLDLMQWDYMIFEDGLYTSGSAGQLLEDIMMTGWDDDSGDPPVSASELYTLRSNLWYHSTMVEEWKEFCEKVKEDPSHEPPLPALIDEELARMEVDLPHGTILYRARIGFVSIESGAMQPFEGADIGAPPREKTRPGRANAEGEICLYTADQEPTAIAEVRPWRGLLVSVVDMTLARTLRLVDLSKIPPPSNPFIDEAPQYERELEDLLMTFGGELGRPLRRADDPRDYMPCQKLVRHIRESGLYDGIRYPSAMVNGGTNVVLFNPMSAQIGPSKLIEVREMAISYDPFEDD
jgi:hypothetical protein